MWLLYQIHQMSDLHRFLLIFYQFCENWSIQPVQTGLGLFVDVSHNRTWSRKIFFSFKINFEYYLDKRLVHTELRQRKLFFPSRMGNTGFYGSVHMESCVKGKGKGVVINWVLCPIVIATATTQFPLPLPQSVWMSLKYYKTLIIQNA